MSGIATHGFEAIDMSGNAAYGHEHTGVEEVAANWFARRRASLSRHDEKVFLEWYAADEAHRLAYDAVASAWSVAGHCEGDPEIADLRRQALAFDAGSCESPTTGR